MRPLPLRHPKGNSFAIGAYPGAVSTDAASLCSTFPGAAFGAFALFDCALAGSGMSSIITSAWTLFVSPAFAESGAALAEAVATSAGTGATFDGPTSRRSSPTAPNKFDRGVGCRRIEGGCWNKPVAEAGSATRAAVTAIARRAPRSTRPGDGGPTPRTPALRLRRFGDGLILDNETSFAGESDAFLDCPAVTPHTLLMSAIHSFVDMPLLGSGVSAVVTICSGNLIHVVAAVSVYSNRQMTWVHRGVCR